MMYYGDQKASKVVNDAALCFKLMAEALERAIIEEYCATCPSSQGKKGCEILSGETVFTLFQGIWRGLTSWALSKQLSLEQWWPALLCFICQLTEKLPIIRVSHKECMKPTIDEGDLVLITRSISPSAMKVGDIATLRAGPGDSASEE